MSRILTHRDMNRLETSVRKIERLVQTQRTRRRGIFPGIDSAGAGFAIPTGRKVYEPIPYQSDPVEYYLTREDRNTLLFWDGPAASVSPHFDGGDRVFYLPDNPEVGDTFFLCFIPLVYVSIRFASLDHSVAASMYDYSGGESNYPFQKLIHSYRFDPDDMRYERAGLLYVNLSGTPRPLTTVVISYTGKVVSRPSSYQDLNGDTYFNLNPGDDEPLIWSDSTCWSIIYESNALRAFLGLNPWWYSYDPWPVERHT